MMFDREIAAEFGLEEAVLIKHFQFWVEKNMADGRHLHDGHTWTYTTPTALSKYFKFWSPRSAERVLHSLRDKGILMVGNYNELPFDRTLWYAFKDESRFTQIRESHLRKRVNGDTETRGPIPDTNTDSSKDVIKERAKRLPKVFVITEEMEDWFKKQGFSFDIKEETHTFIDYWLGRGDTRLDWVATWRTWMRKAKDFKGKNYGKQRDQLERNKETARRFMADGIRDDMAEGCDKGTVEYIPPDPK